jgi:HAD superfamily hydrolase (TIGR01509 family)
MIFDMDGTLVSTEYLKACSYARAINELLLPQGDFDESEVIEAYKDLVCLSRQEVSLALLRRFKLEGLAQARMPELGVSTLWESLAQARLKYYYQMLADPQVLFSHTWPHNLALLAFARQAGCRVGLATMSVRLQVVQILAILELTGVFDVIASREDVEKPQPDLEIYLLVNKKLETAPENCLVIEDSISGVPATLAARMLCIAVTTPMTHSFIHAGKILDERWIVDDPAQLIGVVQQMMDEAGRP